MARKWRGLNKVAEESSELNVELMKLAAFPSGKHPARKRSLILSVEDECADALQAIEYFILRNRLDMGRIQKRILTKRKKFTKWMGDVKPAKIKTTKKSTKAKSRINRASSRTKRDKRT